MTFAPINLIASSDDDTPARTGDRGFGKIGATESAPQSSKAPVEVGEIDEDNRSDPAHTGEIVFEDKDKKVTTESAPQSSEGTKTEILR